MTGGVLDAPSTLRTRVASDAANLRTDLGLGTLATQSGTFSGTSSGTNTGDQTNISGNAATVTTNANLTGPVTSSGNATAIADAALSIAKTSGLQAALDAKQPLEPSPVVLGSDQNTTSTTLVNVTGLAFAMLASTQYVLEIYIKWTSGATACGINLSINGPALPTSVDFNIRIPTAITTEAVQWLRGYDAGTATTGISSISAPFGATIFANIQNGVNAGNLQVRFASEDGTQVTVKAGSVIVPTKVT